MGAWGYAPMENDEALEWLANEVEAPLLTSIKRALQDFLDQTEKDDLKTINAEAAAALFVDLTGDHAMLKYTPFSSGYFGYQAKEDGLWSLAAKVLAKVSEDEVWLSVWNEPDQKRQSLKQLLSDLHRIQEMNK